MKNFVSLFAVVVIVVLVTGCASMVARPVDRADRDTSGIFDGTYTVTQRKGALKQNIEQWVFTCESFDEEYQFTLAVRNGEVTIDGDDNTTSDVYVNAKGDFRAEYELADAAKESASSFASITSGKRTLIIQRNLSNRSSSGLITWGVAQFGNAGCTTRLSFRKHENSV